MGENKIFYQEWLEKGEHDISTARLLYREKGYTDAICFHAQQGAEKHLKAFLAYQGEEVRKIHNLEELIKDCMKFDKNMSDFLDDGLLLTKYYIETRYPSPVPTDYSFEEAKEAIDKAMRISDYIKSKIK
jgi:HEPN domain-containing protein